MRKTQKAAVVATAMLALSTATGAWACSLPAQRPFHQTWHPSSDLNTKKFIQHVTQTIGDDLMGYAVVLRGPDGEILAEATRGWAQSPCEPGGAVPYSLDTVTPWASVSKMVTTAAVLHKTHRFPEKSVEDKMIDYLPNRWQPACYATGASDRCWRDVTLLHLLSYRGGFDKHVNTPFSARIQQGTTELTVGQRQYNNENFAIWEYMGSFFGASKMAEAEMAYTGEPAGYDEAMRRAGQSIYKNYLDRRVLKPLNIKGTCGGVADDVANFALLYNYRDTAGTNDTGYEVTPSESKGCTAGGMTMSVRHMSVFADALVNSSLVIPHSLYLARLANDTPEETPWNKRHKVAGGYMWAKAGGASRKIGGLKKHVGTHMVAFSSGHTVVFATNSFQRDTSWKRAPLIKEAYNLAKSSGPGALSPTPAN